MLREIASDLLIQVEVLVMKKLAPFDSLSELLCFFLFVDVINLIYQAPGHRYVRLHRFLLLGPKLVKKRSRLIAEEFDLVVEIESRVEMAKLIHGRVLGERFTRLRTNTVPK